MVPIRAVDTCFVPFPQNDVWKLVADIESYPHWWPAKLGLRVLSSATDSLGAELEISPSGGRAFRCRVISKEFPSRIEMQYFGGFVEGTGVWLLKPENGGTSLSYTIDSIARGIVVTLLARFCDLGAMHSKQMGSVFDGLICELNRQKGEGPNKI